MAKLIRSPLAPKSFPRLTPVSGVRLSSAASGLRYNDRNDLLLIELTEATKVAGVLTQSLTSAAPVVWCRRALKGGHARALMVNAGNANAFTGRAGIEAVSAKVGAIAKLLDCPRFSVLMASTGVIGEKLPYERIVETLPSLMKTLNSSGWKQGAEAICTTDTFPKGVSKQTTIDGNPVVITGIAKGSGMISPNMATMLAFIFTDAKLPAPTLRTLLRQSNETSFNAITVDSDTSTNDTVLLFATGQANHPKITRSSDPLLENFREALDTVMTDLAHLIVRDGEGASKFVEILVSGASSTSSAKRIARAIANSPLVKTALAGADPNWGRIIMAIGKSGERINLNKLAVRFGPWLVTQGGSVHPRYNEAKAKQYLGRRDVAVSVEVGVGQGQARVWTCDLTHGYIDINTDYRS